MADQPIDLRDAAVGSPGWWLRRLSDRLSARQDGMALHDDYYRGRHRLTFVTQRILSAFGKEFAELRMNFCGVVVDAVNERIAVDGFRLGGETEADSLALDVWNEAGLEATFPRGTRSGLVKGEFAAIVWADEHGNPRVTIEDASQVIVATDPGDQMHRRAALKRWWDPDQRRTFATLFLPDGIWKFQSAASDADPFRATSKGEMPDAFYRGGGSGPSSGSPSAETTWFVREVPGEAWPLPNPLGVVPVVPFLTKPDLFGVGASELEQIISVQNMINANAVNVLLAGQFSAFRQRWATNVALEVDPSTGKPAEPWRIAVDSIMTAPPPDPDVAGEHEVKFGEFAATDLQGYVALHDVGVRAIGTISRTPPHVIMGSSGVFPSGESIRSAEAGLTAKCRERIRDWRPSSNEVITLALRVQATNKSVSAKTRRAAERAAARRPWTIFADPETKNESAHIDAVLKLHKGLGVPQEAAWEMIPAAPAEITRWQEMAAAERAAAIEEARPALDAAARLEEQANGIQPGNVVDDNRTPAVTA